LHCTALSMDDIEAMRPKVAVGLILTEIARRRAENRLKHYAPYQKQADFHTAGADPVTRERLLIAGNQLGKTVAGSFEAAMHLTGLYPDWWKGAVFDDPTTAWAASETSQGTRDTVQRLLLGPVGSWGTGAIPLDKILDIKRAAHGVADAVETILVQHTSGGTSRITLKTYDQGRTRWQGETLDFVWFDEEPPEDIYIEGLTRTNATQGIVWVTFTPLKGISDVVKRFLIDKHVGTQVTTMTIHDAAHYTPEQRAAIIASYPAHEREARSMGIPTLGSGRIFPVDEASIACDPIPIPAHWVQIGGLDFGWDHPSAAVKLAWDRDSDIIYVVAAHRQREQTPVLFSATIKPWGAWLPWAWPHDGLQHDKGSGETLANQYRVQGLKMLKDKATHAPSKNEPEGTGGNGVEAGVLDMLDRMQTGRLKVFKHLHDWFEEFRMYHRKDGKIVKVDDDLLSACLHPDTMVMTDKGSKRIVDLVGTKGRVLSIDGLWADYKNCRLTRRGAYLVKVIFSDGSEIECTPDHKFLTTCGEWVEALYSAGVECHNAVSNRRYEAWKKSSTTASDTPVLESILGVRESFYIGLFGRMLTDPFQRVLTSITRMTTGTTTTLGTLSARTAGSIFQITTQDIPDAPTQPLQRKRFGVRQALVRLFCMKWVCATTTSCAMTLNSFVSAVARVTSHGSPAATGFVPTLVSPNNADGTEQIWCQRFAEYAQKITKQTSSRQAQRVASVADGSSGWQRRKGNHTLSVLRVQSAGSSDVYCMEVPTTHAFALENGAVVHNCRYAMMMKRFATVNQAVKPRRHGADYAPRDTGLGL